MAFSRFVANSEIVCHAYSVRKYLFFYHICFIKESQVNKYIGKLGKYIGKLGKYIGKSGK